MDAALTLPDYRRPPLPGAGRAGVNVTSRRHTATSRCHTAASGAHTGLSPVNYSVVNLPAAVLILTALLAVTVGVGVFLRWQQNRPRHLDPSEVVEPERLGADTLGERATLLQFSTEMCSRCPGVHRTLDAIAGSYDGVLHLDVDLTHRPDIAKHFHVLQTPTTLILDRDGVVQTRFGGTPSRTAVELELARITTEDARV